MKLVGSGGQGTPHYQFRVDGSITTGGTPQLLLPATTSRSMLVVMNISDTAMYIEFGGARAHCALTSGVVSSVTVDNAGFGYTLPPIVSFLGGYPGVTSSSAVAGADTAQPIPTAGNGGGRPATAVAVLSTGTVGSITIQDGGAGYQCPPYVFIHNRREDPFGVADPSVNSGSGILLPANGGSYYVNGTVCTTDAIAIYCASTSKRFTAMWLP